MRVYFGEEDFLTHQALKEFREEFNKKNPQASVVDLEGKETPLDVFLNSLSQGGSLFAEKKLVILRDVFDYNKDQQEKILDFLKNKFSFYDEIELVIVWRGKAKPSKLMNFFKKKGQVKEFKKGDLEVAKKLIFDKTKEVVKIESLAVNDLIRLFGDDMWLLDRELEKLINFKSGQKITQEDVDEMCQGKTKSKIFDLVDAIGAQNKKRALELLKSLRDQGEDSFYILSMMVFQIRNLALVSSFREKGLLNNQEIAVKSGLHPYVIQKTLGQLGRFGTSQVKKIYQMAFSLDKDSKSGKIDIKEALKDFIIKI